MYHTIFSLPWQRTGTDLVIVDIEIEKYIFGSFVKQAKEQIIRHPYVIFSLLPKHPVFGPARKISKV
jgi:hypothetical protein